MLSLLGHAKHRDSDSASFQGTAGVSLADEETVFTSMELFCTRVRNMLDIINTLAQFGKLCEAVKDLPRLPREVLAPEEEVTGEDEGDEEQTGDIPPTVSETSFEEGIDTKFTLYTHSKWAVFIISYEICLSEFSELQVV